LRAREWRKPKEAQMAHFHNLSIFDVSRIEIAFDSECNCYEIKLFEDTRAVAATKLNIWRNAEGGERPELRLEGLSLFPKENEEADI
jgi:hypothetical protein